MDKQIGKNTPIVLRRWSLPSGLFHQPGSETINQRQVLKDNCLLGNVVWLNFS